MSIRYKRTTIQIVLILTALAVMAYPAAAQRSVGVRAGVSARPNQVYFGGHVDLAEVAERIWFRPNLEVGVGDSLTVVTINGEFVYRAPLRSSDWEVYFGGGPSAVISTLRHAPTNYKSDVGAGFNFVVGMQKPKGLMTEIKIGVGDSPRFKAGLGWNF